MRAGNARVSSSNPRKSRLPPGYVNPSAPVACVLSPVEMERDIVNSSGKSLVKTWTDPPAKPPGWSGENVFTVCKLAKRLAGKMSIGTTRRFGSGLGISTLLSSVLLYRSPNPRTNTYRPPTMLTPVTRLIASPAEEAGRRLISSVLMLSSMRELRIRFSRSPRSLDWLSCTGSLIASSFTTCGASATRTGSDGGCPTPT